MLQDISIAGEESLHGQLHLPEGEGPWPGVLLCHGFASCKEEFMALPEALRRAGYAVLAFDYRGHGRSSGARAYFSAYSHLEDTLRAYEALAKAPQVDPAATALIGHSLGTAAVVRFLATKLGQRVKAAVLLAPPHQLRRNVEPLEKLAYTILATVAQPVLQLTGQHMYVPYKIRPEDIYLSAEAAAYAREQSILQSSISLNNYQYLIKEQDNVRQAQQVGTPTLVIAARQDTLVPLAHSRLVFDALACQEKKWLEIEDSGHSMLGDRQAEAVAGHIRDWLDSYLTESPGFPPSRQSGSEDLSRDSAESLPPA